MPNQVDLTELGKRKLCSTQIAEPYLRAMVEKDYPVDACGYSPETGPAIPISDLANLIETAFEQHYERTPDQPNGYQLMMLKDKEIVYDWYREGQPAHEAIAYAADIPEAAARDVKAILADRHGDYEAWKLGEETEFSDDSYYQEAMPDSSAWFQRWIVFQQTVKTEARHFSKLVTKQLDELLGSVDEITTYDGRSLIKAAGPGTTLEHIFRARVFQSDEQLRKAMERPDLELASPPSKLARAGRMNPGGISVFYGATSVNAALAEVRPPVGSQVAVAEFKIIRPLRFLDLTALADIQEDGSIFDPSYAERLGRMRTLARLGSDMARPVLPDDQAAEYLPTQVVADYLAAREDLDLDGIIFPSAQHAGSGLNVVLFRKASRCRRRFFPAGTEYSADTWSDTEDGPEPDYRVFVELPKADQLADEDISSSVFEYLDPPGTENDYDPREETLEIDFSSLRVHVIDAVKVNSTSHKVRRYEGEKVDPPF